MIRVINFIKRKIMNPIEYARYLGVKVGNNCEFYSNITWGSEPYLITIGNNVRITNGCVFVTHDGGVYVLRNLKNNSKIDSFGKIVVGDNVHIGINTIIMPGVKIGSNVVIGAGAIVTKDVPDNSVAVGVPAKVIEGIDDYYNKNKNKFCNTKEMNYKEKKEYLIKEYNLEDNNDEKQIRFK